MLKTQNLKITFVTTWVWPTCVAANFDALQVQQAQVSRMRVCLAMARAAASRGMVAASMTCWCRRSRPPNCSRRTWVGSSKSCSRTCPPRPSSRVSTWAPCGRSLQRSGSRSAANPQLHASCNMLARWILLEPCTLLARWILLEPCTLLAKDLDLATGKPNLERFPSDVIRSMQRIICEGEHPKCMHSWLPLHCKPVWAGHCLR